MALIRRKETPQEQQPTLSRGWDPFQMMNELMRWDPFHEAGWPVLRRGYDFAPAFEHEEMTAAAALAN